MNSMFHTVQESAFLLFLDRNMITKRNASNSNCIFDKVLLRIVDSSLINYALQSIVKPTLIPTASELTYFKF